MEYIKSEMMNYLVREQGYDKEVVKNLPLEDLYDLYEMYHED